MVSPLHVSGRYIRDNWERTIRLRGSTKYGFENYPAGGWWGNTYLHEWRTPWYPGGSWDAPEGREAVERVLDAMKSWGINVVRFPQAISHWKFNIGNHKQIIKELLDMMNVRDMYLIYCPFLIASEPRPGGIGGHLPYPPFQKADGTSVIASEQEFVDFWADLAMELRGYPNVIFELWNEPSSGAWLEYLTGPAFESWVRVTQACIDAIRGAGAQQLMLVQWWPGCWTNLAADPVDYSVVRNLDWLPIMNPRDPLNNIVISTHLYRYHFFAFWQHLGQTRADRVVAWERDDILTAFERFGFESVASRYPLIIGEIGCNLHAASDDPLEGYDTDLAHEIVAFQNCLDIFSESGYHFCTWWWMSEDEAGGRFSEHLGENSGFAPNEGGQILLNALKYTPISSLGRFLPFAFIGGLIYLTGENPKRRG